MKKYLLFVVLFLSCLSIQAQDENEALVSIAKMNWVGVSELPSWCNFSGDNDTSLEFVDDGIAINNPQKYDAIYTPQIIVIEGFTLEKGHNYIVRLIVRVPSDGTQGIKADRHNVIYNLNGQRVSPPYRGIVIQNGRKVVK